jgi:hypothetical protein
MSGTQQPPLAILLQALGGQIENTMAYNLKLAEWIRSEPDGIPFVEKKMFGGVGLLLNGNTPALRQVQVWLAE